MIEDWRIRYDQGSADAAGLLEEHDPDRDVNYWQGFIDVLLENLTQDHPGPGGFPIGLRKQVAAEIKFQADWRGDD